MVRLRKYAVQGLSSIALSILVMSFGFANNCSAEDSSAPWYYTSIGWGGVFYDHGEEVDETNAVEWKLGFRGNDYLGAEFTFGGLPDINNRSYESPDSFELDEDTSALKFALDGLFYPLGAASNRFDPFLAVTGGVLTYEDDLEEGKSDPYAGLGFGTFVNLTDHWFLRGDYRVVVVFEDSEWNQHALLSVGYSWGKSSDQSGSMAAGETDEHLRGASLPLKPVYFAFDSSKLSKEAQATLQENAAWLKNNSSTKINVEGHCDERGTNEYNMALGERRANSAEDFLKTLGIPQEQLSTQSFGEEFPADPGHNETAWKMNRRAEFRDKK